MAQATLVEAFKKVWRIIAPFEVGSKHVQVAHTHLLSPMPESNDSNNQDNVAKLDYLFKENIFKITIYKST